MATRSLLICCSVLALFAVSCTNNMLERKMTLQDDFGNAVKTNIAAQTINPDAGKEPVPIATRDGQKTEQALERYRAEESKAESGSILDDISQ